MWGDPMAWLRLGRCPERVHDVAQEGHPWMPRAEWTIPSWDASTELTAESETRAAASWVASTVHRLDMRVRAEVELAEAQQSSASSAAS